MEVDSDTADTTNTLSLQLVRFVDREDNDRTAANSRLIVKINLHQRANGATGI